MPAPATLDRHFPRYTDHDPKIPVWCLTPHEGRCLHRFFDTNPLSPDGRRMACLRLPFEDRVNRPGEAAEVVVVDLEEGGERVVATTRGWEFQMGANLNWSGNRHVVFNDVGVDSWTPRLVKLDVESGEKMTVDGAGVYHVSPDGLYAAAASLEKMRRTQEGYGVLVPDDRSRRNVGAVDDDGLWITDLYTGERRLALSLADAARHVPDLQDLSKGELDEWEIYGFHSKFNPQGDRVMFTLRRYRHGGKDRFNAFGRGDENGGVRFDVLTLRPDGTGVHDALPADRWTHGGHHTHWFPDGDHLSANVRLPGEKELSLIRVRHDGSDFRKITGKTIGSGHPIVHPCGKVLADTYSGEGIAFGDGSVPLRWIDPATDTETTLVRVHSKVEPQPSGTLRVDAHPAWDRSYRLVAFNGVAGNTRRVFLGDVSSLI